eukprot:6214195-Pleurochrysis_carterae.AAC.13
MEAEATGRAGVRHAAHLPWQRDPRKGQGGALTSPAKGSRSKSKAPCSGTNSPRKAATSYLTPSDARSCIGSIPHTRNPTRTPVSRRRRSQYRMELPPWSLAFLRACVALCRAFVF